MNRMLYFPPQLSECDNSKKADLIAIYGHLQRKESGLLVVKVLLYLINGYGCLLEDR